MSREMKPRGKFVVLRPLDVQDAALSVRWRNSERGMHLNRGAATAEEQAHWIATRPPSEYNFMIERVDGVPIGMVALTEIDLTHRRAMPGRFLIGETAEVRGIPAAAEAMSLILALAFDTLDLHRIHGTVASDNHLMIKWQKYIGLREEGRLRDHYLINGRYQDAVCFGLLADEYRTVTVPRLAALVGMAHPLQP